MSSREVSAEVNAEVNPEQYGTRARGTESLLCRILQTPEYRTEEVIARFIDAAITPAQPQDMIRERARKFLMLVARYGESAIPKNVWELVSWTELSADEDAGPIEAIVLPDAKRKRARRTRHFKTCKHCGVRFLAKRSDQEFHSPQCRVRWNRSPRLLRIIAPSPLEPA